jgi:CubicO group peptidase (beta-lactamase class C family)
MIRRSYVGRRLPVVAVVFTTATRLLGQAPTTAGLRAVDSMAGAEFARDSIASLTIGIVTAQGLAWSKSYGFADMATHRLADRQSVYRIGSITKMFTALMLQQLMAAGKIRLSDPVERYYPPIREVNGYTKLAAPITVLQLATMTSGLAREPKPEGPFWTGPVSLWDSTLHTALPHTEFELPPGTKFQYSNIGYAILGATLGMAAHVPYVRWETEQILDPLGMRHTVFEIDPRIMPDLTRGYDLAQDGTFDGTPSAREAITGRGFKVPNGAIFTTVDDLSRFLVLQLGHGPEAVASHARLDSIYHSFVKPNGEPAAQYGLGFVVEQHGQSIWFGHSGGVSGYTSVMLFDREHQLGVIVLRNATGGNVRIGDLATRALQQVVAPK